MSVRLYIFNTVYCHIYLHYLVNYLVWPRIQFLSDFFISLVGLKFFACFVKYFEISSPFLG